MSERSMYVLRPGVEIYRLSHREYLIRYGLAPQFSFMIKDESKTIVSNTIFSALMRGGINLDEILTTVNEPEEAQQLLNELMRYDLLVQATALYRVAQNLASDSKVKLGIIGTGLSAYLAIEIAARLQTVVAQALIHVSPSEVSHPYLKTLFPYLDSEHLSIQKLIQCLHLMNWKEVDSPEKVIIESDIILVVYSDFEALELMEMDKRLARAKKPWFFTLIGGNVALVGPLIVPGQTACFREFLEYARIAGLLPLIEGDRLFADRGANVFLSSPYHLVIQAVAVTVYEGIRYALMGESRFRGAIVIYDEDRGLVTRGKVMRIPGYASQETSPPQDPPVIPKLLLSEVKE
jgi:hypothetical protein